MTLLAKMTRLGVAEKWQCPRTEDFPAKWIRGFQEAMGVYRSFDQPHPRTGQRINAQRVKIVLAGHE
jgi:hypothetical protein